MGRPPSHALAHAPRGPPGRVGRSAELWYSLVIRPWRSRDGAAAIAALAPRDPVALASSTIPILIAVYCLVGWSLGLEAWVRWGVQLPPMVPTAALSVLLLGTALGSAARFLDGSVPSPRTARTASVLVLAIAGASLLAYTAHWTVGPEHLLPFPGVRQVGTPYPGRMSPQSATALVFLSIGLLAVLTRPARLRLAQVLGAGAATLAMIAFAGHIHGTVVFFGMTNAPGVAVPTAIALLALAAGLVALDREHGVRAMLDRPGPTGRYARWLAFAAVAIPFGVALVLRGGELLGWYNADFRSAAYVALTVLLLCGVAWVAARSLFRMEKEREQLAAERSARAVAEALARNLEAQVAERQRLLAEVRDALRVRDQFLSLAAHELRTPLTSLKLQTQSLSLGLAKGRADPERVGTSLERIGRQVKRLEQLVSNLLDVSRIAEGRLRIAPEEVELEALTRSIADRFTERFRTAGSALELETAPVTGRWDPGALDHVLSNLLDNAAKYGGGRPVHVRVEAAGAGARITVRDAGIGIPAEHRGRIFDRFQRAPGSQPYGGLGLGLWIARQLVEAMAGRIWVTSSPGQGSTFVVELPLEPPAAADAAGKGADVTSSAPALPPDLVTGHAALDAQHLAMLEELARMRTAPAHAIWGSLQFLAQHTASHFGYEELLMAEADFPGRELHAQEHAEFLEELGLRRARLERDGATPENVAALLDSVEKWVTEHVLVRDIAMTAYVRAR
jgi:hemerythrin-like metal-binding protein